MTAKRRKKISKPAPLFPKLTVTGTSARVLISRLSAHGDVIQTLPLLAALKKENPDLYVGWLVEESAAPLLKNHPLINRLHISKRKTWLKSLKHPFGLFLNLPGVLNDIFSLIQELRQEGYTLSLDVQGLTKSAIFPFLCGIPNRLGYRNTREWADLWYTHKLPPHDLKNPDIPAVVKFMEFAGAIGVPDTEIAFPLPPLQEHVRLKAKRMVGEKLKPDQPVVAIAPFTIWPTKHWPDLYWQELLVALTDQSATCLLIGTEGDREHIQTLLRYVNYHENIIDLAGKTSLTDLYAILPMADVLIGPDSAPLHIAQAVASHSDTPRILGLFGSTSAKRTGPMENSHATLSLHLPCQPCFRRQCALKTHECMVALTPAMVFNTLSELLCEKYDDWPPALPETSPTHAFQEAPVPS